MKKFVVLAVVLVLTGAGTWYRLASGKTLQEQYRFTKVERGDLESIVSSTGTLSAVSTVQVGTQVSGTIARMLVDFNQQVHQGDLVALIDTTFLAASVRDAEGSFDRVRAQFDQAEREHTRVRALVERGMSADSDLEQAQYNLDMARSAVKSAQASLDRARINLQYAWIYAPTDGTVIDRKVDVGQTVAANFSAPTLFLIAHDLSQMQILANVDESDIGQIADGQQVRFTVQAYPGRTFWGKVTQVRLQPTTIQNVVNYTVVINVENQERLLLPGMTATVDFLLARATGVLKVANAALRFRPTTAMLAEVRKQWESRSGAGEPGGESAKRLGNGTALDQAWAAGRREGSPGGGGAGSQREGGAGNSKDTSLLWCLDGEGRLQMVRVRTGISDGQMTEIRSDGISEGLPVISGLAQSSAPPAGPFGPGGPPPPGGGRMF